MEKESIIEMFEDKYKLKLSEKDKARINEFFKKSDINQDNVKIEVMSDKGAYINNSFLNRTLHFNRINPQIELEDVLFSLHPIQFGTYTDISLSYPKKSSHDYYVDSYIYNEFDQNIIIIRSAKFDSVFNRFDIRYIISIYNKDLDVRNGIIFEKIENEK